MAGYRKTKLEDQSAKKDAGKAKLSLVPTEIIYDIAKVREYGNKKYGDSNSWKRVNPQRYIDAAYRHFLAFVKDNKSVDEESGLSHLSHLACNIAFLSYFEKQGFANEEATAIHLSAEDIADFSLEDADTMELDPMGSYKVQQDLQALIKELDWLCNLIIDNFAPEYIREASAYLVKTGEVKGRFDVDVKDSSEN